MNICMFTNTYLPHVGGVARSVDMFTQDLRELGHPVLVVAPTFPDAMEDEGGEEILRVPAIQNFNGSDFSVRLAVPFVIAGRIKDFQPDIIHSHHPYLLGDAALRTARRHDLPLVFTHHTLYEKYTHYTPLDSKAMRRFVINLSTQYANMCTRVVAPSRSVAELIRQRGVTAPIEELPTGVDLEFMQKGDGARFRRAHGIDRGDRVVGHLGRLAPEKNLSYLAEAAAGLLSRENGVFLVVGDGASAEDIRRIFQDRDLENRLVMTGKLTGEDLRDAYHAMDLFVFASKTETQGMVLVEAMAAGLPVVALDAPGVREVIRDKENGRLLPGAASTEIFAEAAAEGFRDPEAARTWSRGALSTAESFSRKHMAERLLRLYLSAQYGHQGDTRPPEEFIPWDKLLRGLKAEWDLLSQKATASMESMKEEER